MLKIIVLSCLILTFSCSKDDTNIPTQVISEFLGETEWFKTFGGTQEDLAQDVIITSDGKIVVFGSTKSINGDINDHLSEDNDFWMSQFSSDGSLLWSKTYGGTAEDRGQAIIQTNDGGFAAVGYSRSTDGDVTGNAGFYDKWIIKVDATGILQWQKSFGFSGSDQAFSIIQTQDGGYFVGGFLDVSSSGGLGDDPPARSALHGVGEFWGHKLDANGNMQWRRYFGGTNNDRSFDAIQTSDGGFVLMGSSESNDFDISNPNGSYDFWMVKINASSQLVWEKSFGGSNIDNGYAITNTPDGGFLLVGDTNSEDGDVTNLKGAFDLWVIKTDANGNLQWQKTYGGSSYDTGRDVVALKDGGYAIAGFSRSNDLDLNNNYGQTDCWVIQIDNAGVLQWQKNFGGSDFDFAYGITETADGKLVVVGDTSSNDNNVTLNKGMKDILVIKIK